LVPSVGHRRRYQAEQKPRESGVGATAIARYNAVRCSLRTA